MNLNLLCNLPCRGRIPVLHAISRYCNSIAIGGAGFKADYFPSWPPVGAASQTAILSGDVRIGHAGTAVNGLRSSRLVLFRAQMCEPGSGGVQFAAGRIIT